jgi:hypothetical protein
VFFALRVVKVGANGAVACLLGFRPTTLAFIWNHEKRAQLYQLASATEFIRVHQLILRTDT